jgi:hypothetical protein
LDSRSTGRFNEGLDLPCRTIGLVCLHRQHQPVSPVHGDVEYVHPGHVEQGIRPSAPAHADATRTVIHVGAFIRIGCLVAADPEGPDLLHGLATPPAADALPTLKSEEPLCGTRGLIRISRH